MRDESIGLVNKNSYNMVVEDPKDVSPSTYNFRKRLNMKAKEYSNTFSAHAMTRIARGPIVEKIYWILILSSLLGAIAYPIYLIIDEFLKSNVREQTAAVVVERNAFPAVSLCTQRRNKRYYCGSDSLGDYPLNVDLHKPCPHKTPLEKAIRENAYLVPAERGSYKSQRWTNIDHFQFECPLGRLECRREDLDELHFNTTNNARGNCVTWNGLGGYNNREGKLQLVVKILDSSYNQKHEVIEMIVHEPGVDGALLHESALSIKPESRYDVTFDKYKYKRIPSPLIPCTYRKENDIFPGKYTLENCVNSAYCKRAFFECGDTFDYCQRYISSEYNLKYKRNDSISKVAHCLNTIELPFPKECRLPCENDEYSVTAISNNDEAVERYEIALTLKLSQPNVYTEKRYVFYSSYAHLVAQIAGVFSLVVGGIFMVLIELLSFAVLSC